MRKPFKNYLINLIVPSIVFGSTTGVFTATVVIIYKILAGHIISFSEHIYAFLRNHLYFLPIALVLLMGISFLLSNIYKKMPNLKGGGIPTSIATLRGIISFKWIRNIIGVFTLSLVSFLLGVPLGNEGPSVQMGTAIGRGTIRSFAKKHRAWDRYSMTGGACAGFSVATGAPISGIMFAIEEAHQRISPMIIIVSAISVIFASITNELLSPLLNVNPDLFDHNDLVTLTLKDIWLPICVGIAVGIFAVIFFKYYKILSSFFNKTLQKISSEYKIFIVLVLTLGAGLISDSFISTGHHLLLSLFDSSPGIIMLLLILIIRSTLTLSANTNGITGGMFIPLLVLGALVSAVFGQIIIDCCGLDPQYFSIILTFGIIACIASVMKTPITAVMFAIEALGCHMNIIYVITVSAVSYIITEIFGAKSINDIALEDKTEAMSAHRTPRLIDTFVTVKGNSFAIGKQIRDIFWPANLFVLSISHDKNRKTIVDEHGGNAILEGDILHIRYSTYDDEDTKEQLYAIVGEQDIDNTEVDI